MSRIPNPDATSGIAEAMYIDRTVRGQREARERERRRMVLNVMRTTPFERQSLLPGLMADPALMAAAAAALDGSAFSRERSDPYRIVADALFRYYREHHAVPGFDTLRAQIAQMLGGGNVRTQLTALPAGVETLVVHLCFPPEAGERDPEYYRTLLRRVIGDHQVMRLQSDLMTAMNCRPNLEIMTQLCQEALSLEQAVIVRPPQGLIPDARAGFGVGVDIPTGVPFLDRTLEDGACQAGKLYGVLGPFGGGKTTLGVQILTSTAAALDARNEPGVCVYFSFEDYRTVALKTLTQTTAIARPSLKRLLDPENNMDLGVLSTTGRLLPYETAHYDRLGVPLADRLGERERWARAQALHGRFAIYDKDDPMNESAGRGGVAELDADLTALERAGRPVKLVVIDYLKRLADRQAAAGKAEQDGDLKKYSDRAMNELKRLAVKHGCAVWVLQQMNADANRKPEGGGTHHADAAGSTAFGESVWACFTLGRSDTDMDNVRQLRQTKSRDTQLAPATVVGWDRWTHTLVEASDYTVSRGRIVSGRAAAVVPGQPARENPGDFS